MKYFFPRCYFDIFMNGKKNAIPRAFLGVLLEIGVNVRQILQNEKSIMMEAIAKLGLQI